MRAIEQTSLRKKPDVNCPRNWLAASLGVRPERKAEIYLDISKSATLKDVSDWLQRRSTVCSRSRSGARDRPCSPQLSFLNNGIAREFESRKANPLEAG